MQHLKNTGRLAGLLYLTIAILAGFSMMYMPATLIVDGAINTTASNILSSEGLFRLALVSDGLIFLIEIVLSVVLYGLFQSVNRTLALTAATFRVAMSIIQGMNVLNYFAVLALLGGAEARLSAQQLGQAEVFLALHGAGVLVWQLFFGCHLIALSYLAATSGYVPRIFGWLLGAAAVGYLGNSLGIMLMPSARAVFDTLVMVLAPLPELAFTLWLMIKGIERPDHSQPRPARMRPTP